MSDLAFNLFIQQARHELWNGIMPFWLRHSADGDGGFIGRMSNDLVADHQAGKGLVLNARLLWSFSAMYQNGKNAACLNYARRAYDYIRRYFLDSEFGGGFWMLRPDGRPADSSKKIYGQAFLIYALSEYYQCTRQMDALANAIEVFSLLDEYALDRVCGGYSEVFNRDWSLCADQRLSDKDMDEKKSMNNHLHLLEAFTNLYRVSRHPLAAERLKMLTGLFAEKIWNSQTQHFDLFFDETWNRKSDMVSFGHDIEAAWLLCDAAQALEDAGLIQEMRALAAKIAQVTYDEARHPLGGLCYERDASGRLNENREFWCQAEGVIGFLNAYQVTGKEHFYDAAAAAWTFIEKTLIDRNHGEWFLRIDPANRPDLNQPKISEWKDPYHNSRCCLEAIGRLSSLMNTREGQREAIAYE